MKTVYAGVTDGRGAHWRDEAKNGGKWASKEEEKEGKWKEKRKKKNEGKADSEGMGREWGIPGDPFPFSDSYAKCHPSVGQFSSLGFVLLSVISPKLSFFPFFDAVLSSSWPNGLSLRAQ